MWVCVQFCAAEKRGAGTVGLTFSFCSGRSKLHTRWQKFECGRISKALVSKRIQQARYVFELFMVYLTPLFMLSIFVKISVCRLIADSLGATSFVYPKEIITVCYLSWCLLDLPHGKFFYRTTDLLDRMWRLKKIQRRLFDGFFQCYLKKKKTTHISSHNWINIEEARDWFSLPPELIENIASRGEGKNYFSPGLYSTTCTMRLQSSAHR